MILQSLNNLYDRLADDPAYELAHPGFSPQKISFRVVLHPDGRLFQMQDARVPNDKKKLITSVVEVPGEAKPSGAGINPCFLWDNQTYLLGRQPEDKPEGFGSKRFEAFREKHLQIEGSINNSGFSAVCRFLESWSPNQLAAHPILEEVGTGFGVFQILDQPHPVHAEPEIRKWWEKNMPVEADAPIGQCLISGETVPIARLHPKIKGISGAQAAGASIVSFNDSAYESYGKSQSFNAPVGAQSAFRYGTALNSLLTGPQSAKHRIRIGDTTCVFWTDKKTLVEDVFAAFSQNGTHIVEDESQDPVIRQKLLSFLKALQNGREDYGGLGENPDETRFYLLGLAPNAARLSVRFFHQSTISELLDNLRTHQEAIRLVREFDKQVGKRRPDSEFPAYWEYLRETVRGGDDPSPLLGGAFMRSILEATPYPEALFTTILRRTLMEREVNYLRASAIKAVLIRNHQLHITTMLDQENTNTAYLLGRLFAVLEKIQEEGHYEQTGNRLEKTIRETYFSAACATPAAVFPRVEQLSTHHRRHLNPGRKIFFDQLIGEIKWPQSPEKGIKKTHNLEAQGLFILGYYHQRKALFTSNKDKELSAA